MPRGTLTHPAGRRDFALRWPADTIVRMTTGTATNAAERVTWLVGQIDSGGRQYVFASRVRRPAADPPDTPTGVDLALRVLNTIDPAAAGR